MPAYGTVYGCLLNYRSALAAFGDAVNAPPYQAPPKAPILYIKPPNTLNAPGAPIVLPRGVEAVEIGPALGLVIGRT
ncbi:MAG: fumarylacetoacetate hydrolase family protein, partial [Ferrovibrionaceae bacterium]